MSTVSGKTPFITIEGAMIQADTIISLERVSARKPSDQDAFTVTYTAGGHTTPLQDKISYHIYCALRSARKA